MDSGRGLLYSFGFDLLAHRCSLIDARSGILIHDFRNIEGKQRVVSISSGRSENIIVRRMQAMLFGLYLKREEGVRPRRQRELPHCSLPIITWLA